MRTKVIKAYHLFSRRNEWTNWNGDTDLVNRSHKSVYLTLSSAEAAAERQRTPGTKFEINEIPAVVITTKSNEVLLTTLFAKKPLQQLDDRAISSLNPDDFVSEVNRMLTHRWDVNISYELGTVFDEDTQIFYRRTSSPGKGQNSLAWSLSIYDVDFDSVKRLL